MAGVSRNVDDMCVIGRSPFLNYEDHNFKTDYHNNCIGSGYLPFSGRQKSDDIFIPKSSSCWYLNDHHLDSEFKTYKSLKALDSLSEKINSIRYDNCDKHIDIIKPIDTNELARKYFPITLGKTYEIDAQIQSKERPPWSMTFSPPANGLPSPETPWRVPTMHNRAQLRRNWVPAERHLEKNAHWLDSVNGTGTVVNDEQSRLAAIRTPYQAQLSQSRLDRLRLEDELLMEVKRQEELERIRGPEPRWYELRDASFHYEARKNNELLKSTDNWQQLFDYRNTLRQKSDEFHDKYSSDRGRNYDPTNYIPVS